MREPAFWWRPPGLAARLLWPLGWIYGAVSGRRMRRAGLTAGIPVICVGNFTLGGTGKTPTAIAIAALLAERGERPSFLTRGYGGQLTGPLQVDPVSHRASDVGDEPLLLARHWPTVVARDRAAGAAFAQAAGATVVVMDDGLQNPSLHKDLSIAVIDGRRGFGNGYVFPAGPLRAPIEIQLRSVRAMLVVGAGAGSEQVAAYARATGLTVLAARLEARPDAARTILPHRAYAFAGIGDPEKFFATLRSTGIEAAVEAPFGDHHSYSENEAAHILARCDAEGLVPVTTEKDLARLAGLDGSRGRLAAAARTIAVSLVPEEPERIRRLLSTALAAHRSAR